jgi:hypothetical protein
MPYGDPTPTPAYGPPQGSNPYGMPNMGSSAGYMGAANMGTTGTANLAGGIYNQFWGMPQYNDYLKTLPDLSGDINQYQKLIDMYSNSQMPEYMSTAASEDARRSNAAAGLGDSPLGASVESQNVGRTRQAWDSWRLQQLAQALQQHASMSAAQRARMSEEAAQQNQAQQGNIENIAGGLSGILGGGASWMMNMLPALMAG